MVTKKKAEVTPLWKMPVEVKEWIERAESRMNWLSGEVERLKKENEDLKSYRKFAEQRILKSDHE